MIVVVVVAVAVGLHLERILVGEEWGDGQESKKTTDVCVSVGGVTSSSDHQAHCLLLSTKAFDEIGSIA